MQYLAYDTMSGKESGMFHIHMWPYVAIRILHCSMILMILIIQTISFVTSSSDNRGCTVY